MLSKQIDPEPTERSATEPSAVQNPKCIHCGLSVPEERSVSHHQARFCCNGCETAWLILQDDDDLKALFPQQPVAPSDAGFAQMDHKVFHDQHVQRVSESHLRVRLLVEGITCASCVWAIEKLPSYLNGVIQARVNMSTAMVTVDWNPSQVALSEIAVTLSKLNYLPHPADETRKDDLDRAENRRRLVQMAIAGACAGNTMLIAFALYFGVFSGMAAGYLQLFRWTSAGIATVSLFWPGRTFFRNAWNSLRTRTPHMDLPVAVGLSAGMCLGIVNTWLGRGEVYFDSLTVLVFLLLVGRYVQYCQQRKAIRQVSLRNALIPQAVHRCLDQEVALSATFDESQVETIPPEAIRVGDLLWVRAGDLLPVDAEIQQGQSTLDEAILTGESHPISKSPGQQVSAGTTNLTAPLLIKVTRAPGQSRLDRITELVEEGIQAKTPIVQFANRIGGYFVAIILLLAGTTFLIWSPTGIEVAFNHSLSLLVVACPCALGLATPFTIAIAQARAAARGMLIKSGDTFERLNQTSTIWFDKTGTVTKGHPQIHEWFGDRSVIPVVVAVEQHVVHPLAASLVSELGEYALDSVVSVDHVEVIAGLGVIGYTNGQRVLIGSEQLLRTHGCKIDESFLLKMKSSHEQGHTGLMIAVEDRCVAMCSLGDSIRPDAASVISELQHQGHKVGLLSGDHPDVVRHVAEKLGVANNRARGRMTPEAKLETIKLDSLQGNVVMVGDGVNDSAALAAAGVGVAVQGGTAVSMEAADVYMKQQGLSGLLTLLGAARQTVRTIWINFAASLSYNLLAAALAMAGYIHPIAAAILMPLSSVTVVLIAFLNPAFRKFES